MGIRGRLLLLLVRIAVPLVLVGVADLRGMWSVSRSQLDDSVKQQAELAAIAFERWVDAQRQPLVTIAAICEDTSGAILVGSRKGYEVNSVSESGGECLRASSRKKSNNS